MPTQVINEHPLYIADRQVYFVEKGEKPNELVLNTLIDEFYYAPGSEQMAYTSMLQTHRIKSYFPQDSEYAVVNMIYLNQKAVRAQVQKFEPIEKGKNMSGGLFNRTFNS